MMTEAILHLELLSAATFGRGDGVAGLVDREIEHDEDGFPFLRGRTLKGLLFEAAEDLVFALREQGDESWEVVRNEVFGRPGSGVMGQGILHVGDARIPDALRALARNEYWRTDKKEFHPDEVIAACTGIRRQTAMNPDGGPAHGTLRSMRVVLRGMLLESALLCAREPEGEEWALLTGAALGLRSAGTGRNRGRGRLRATLNSDEFMRRHFALLRGAGQENQPRAH
ncbi:MAG TPA: RAMP superfamily CRISPR-associated protein [Blastocatellia bacterium]|nr:RAMP superfamily CRISPR-associated protein [Blastocatellia bacterium]